MPKEQSSGTVPRLDRELCFSIYACSKELIKLYTPYLEQINLTYTQYLTMLILWEKKQATVKELGEKLYLNSATMTPLLKKLESKGLVTRNRMKTDERNVLIQITKAGDELKSSVSGLSEELLKQLELEENETKVLFILMNKILNKISSEE